ncbi:histidine kinase [Bifidobacterium margollesii]|nr:histidine kinase [Bifidobacterium margollesii]
MTDSSPSRATGPESWGGRPIAWWHELTFPDKVRLFTAALWLTSLLAFHPESVLDAIAVLALLAVIALLPRHPRITIAIGLAACLASGFVTTNLVEAAHLITLFAIFLTGGYALARGWAVVAVTIYSVAETTCAIVWNASSVALDTMTSFVNGFLDGYSGTQPGASDIGGGSVSPILAWTFSVLLSILVNGFLVAFGRAFRVNTDARRTIVRNEALLERVTREQRIARMIHDSVANDMSVVAMLSWRLRQTLPERNATDTNTDHTAAARDGIIDNTDAASMLDTIYDRSHHALDRVHEVIDVLDGRRTLTDTEKTTVDTDDTAIPLSARVEKLVEEQDRTMTMLGMNGTSHIDITDDTQPSQAVTNTVLSLMEEIYANIVRHAAWNGSEDGNENGIPVYSLFVTGTRDVIRVTEINRITDEESHVVRGTRHGKGLDLHRSAIEALDGTLNTSAQEGTWTIAAELPLR